MNQEGSNQPALDFTVSGNTWIDQVNDGINKVMNYVKTLNPDGTPKEQPKNDDYVEYTYKQGDTFGQVIRDLGLESGNGLWGGNGDVEYYTKQLEDQGFWPNGTRGNIPVGSTIRLKRRDLTPELAEYRAQNEKKDEEKKEETKWVDPITQATELVEKTVKYAQDHFNPDGTPKQTEDEGEYVEYTYKPGDTFGQVVRDLGLESGNGLWGDNGDVEFYTKQLEEQLQKAGIWPQGTRQNIPIGTTIRLKKRELTPEMQAYRNQYGYK